MRTIPQVALDFIKAHEGLVLSVYRDSAGLDTAGYGHRGADVVPGMVVTQAQADTWLESDCERAGRRLAAVVRQTIIDSLTDNQYAAILAFVFNLGAAPSWNIWNVLNSGNLAYVPAEMLKFVKIHVNGLPVVSPGLQNRRQAEVDLWLAAKPNIAVSQTDPPQPPK